MLRGSLSSISAARSKANAFGARSSLVLASPRQCQFSPSPNMLSAALQSSIGPGNNIRGGASLRSYRHNHHSLFQPVTRSLATSAQKRAMAQQGGKDGKDDVTPKTALEIDTAIADDNKASTSPSSPLLPSPSPANTTDGPATLIRTDFGLNSSSNQSQELILPSGYEIPLSNMDNSTSAMGEQQQQQTRTPTDAAAFSYVDYKELYDPNIHLPSAPQDWTDYEAATPLWEELAAQIGVLGRPMTVAEFMQQALLHPKYGYYSQPMRDSAEEDGNIHDDDMFSDEDEDSDDDDENNNKTDNPIFGPRGDFVTAPEICQVFGESIQVWMVTQWEAMGKPKAMQWVEFGPGRGTLMADMVRFALSRQQHQQQQQQQQQQSSNNNNNNSGAGYSSDKLEEYGNALQVIHLIEPSRPLRQKQQASLQEQLGDLVDWTFHNPVVEDAANVTDKATTDESVETTTPRAKPSIQVHWHDSFASLTAMLIKRKQRNVGHESAAAKDADEVDIADMPCFVICQEFFDALPVHAFEMTEDGWRERMVDMAIRDELLEDDDDDEDGNNGATTKSAATVSPSQSKEIEGVKRPRLRIVLAPEVTPALKTLLNVDEDGKSSAGPSNSSLKAEPGQVVEVCPEGILVVQDIAAILEQQGGAAVIVDYGEEGSKDSLRGFWKHKQTHFLSLPGQTDVTADVDFTALKHAVNHARPDRIQQFTQASSRKDKADTKNEDKKNVIRAYGPISQGKFLISMGAQERVISHIQQDSTTDEEAEVLFNALNRLVAPDEMGTRYKVLGIAAQRHKQDGNTSFTIPPPGF